VARHSSARSVRLALRRDDGGLVLTVTDDGAGIPDEALRAKGSLGLLGMSERAAMLGGTVSIRRGEDGGTIASLVFPENP
jgi:signal transduction histidine kinase